MASIYSLFTVSDLTNSKYLLLQLNHPLHIKYSRASKDCIAITATEEFLSTKGLKNHQGKYNHLLSLDDHKNLIHENMKSFRACFRDKYHLNNFIKNWTKQSRKIKLNHEELFAQMYLQSHSSQKIYLISI